MIQIALLALLQQDPTVAAGGVQFTNPDGTTLRIDQLTDKAIINWREFGVREGHLVQFAQPGGGAIALNRVVGADPSRILGALQANGQVWILNPNGIVFGPNARVDVGGLMASSLAMTDADFLAGNYRLGAEGPAGAVLNDGRINAEQYAALIAPVVENYGSISGGKVYILGGREAILTLSDDGLVNVSLGTVTETGDVVLHSDGISSIVGTQGLTPAGKIEVGDDGVVRLVGSKGVAVAGGTIEANEVTVASGGVTAVTGTIAAPGGPVDVFGEVVVLDGATIDASGAEGAGGSVRVGGDYRGEGDVPNAKIVYAGSDTVVRADAGANGDGGRVIFWADDAMLMHGSISAEGGAEGGDGGFIETSGKFLDIRGASFSTRAPEGATGLLLLDPVNVNFVAGTADGDDPDGVDSSFDNDFDFIAGTAPFFAGTPTTINESEIEGIAAGTDILIEAFSNITFGAGTFDLDQSGTVTFNAMNNFDSSAATINMTDGTSTLFIIGSAMVTLGAVNAAGDLSITSFGDITATAGALVIGGTADFAGSPGSIVTATNAGNDFGGAVTFLGLDVSLVDTDDIAVGFLPSTAVNNLSITAGGPITDSGALTVGNITTLTAGAGNDITFNNAGGDFATVAIVSGLNVTLNDANAVDLAASTVSGTLTVTSNGAITDSGALAVTGLATFAAGAANNVTLDEAGNNFSTVAVTSGNNVTIVDTNAVILGASTISGTLGVTAGGTITDGAGLTVTGATTLAAGAANDIALINGGNNFSTVGITSGNNVTLVDAAGIDLGASTVSGTLAVTATTGNITDSGALAVTGTSTFTATAAGADVILDFATHTFTGTVAFAGGGLRNVTVTDTTTLDLAALTLTGNLTVTAAGITQSGALVVPGTATLTATGAGNDITLGNAANNFGTVALTSADDATIVDMNAVNLAASIVGGNLDITSTAGSITDSGLLTVTGTSTFTASAGNDILLDFPTHVLTGAITIAPAVGLRHLAITRTTALALPATTLTGNLSVTALGITQTGALIVPGTSTLTATGGTDVMLANAANNFGTVGASGANVTIVDANAINLTTSNVTGALAVTANGNITDSGALNVGGNSTFTANGDLRNILLDTATNTFTGTVAFATDGILGAFENLTITDTTPLVLPALFARTNLSVTAPGIMQSGSLRTGTATLTAGTGDITLTDPLNDFGTVSIVSGKNVTLEERDTIFIGNSNVSGNYSLTAGNAIGQTGPLTVGGTTTLSSGAGFDIVLNNAGNDFVGAVTVLSGRSVSLVDANDILIDKVSSNTLGIDVRGGSIMDTTNEKGRISATTSATLVAVTAIGSQANPFDITVCDLTLTTGGVLGSVGTSGQVEKTCDGTTTTIGGAVNQQTTTQLINGGSTTGTDGKLPPSPRRTDLRWLFERMQRPLRVMHGHLVSDADQGYNWNGTKETLQNFQSRLVKLIGIVESGTEPLRTYTQREQELRALEEEFNRETGKTGVTPTRIDRLNTLINNCSVHTDNPDSKISADKMTSLKEIKREAEILKAKIENGEEVDPAEVDDLDSRYKGVFPSISCASPRTGGTKLFLLHLLPVLLFALFLRRSGTK